MPQSSLALLVATVKPIVGSNHGTVVWHSTKIMKLVVGCGICKVVPWSGRDFRRLAPVGDTNTEFSAASGSKILEVG